MTTIFPPAEGQPGAAKWLMAEFRDSLDALFDPDTITSIEILNADGSVNNTFETGWEKVSTGIYRLAYNLPEGELYIWHVWNIVNGGISDKRAHRINIKK